MRRYLRFGAIAFCAIAILAAAVGATVAFAGSPDSDLADDGGPGQVLISKVAGILGLYEGQVADAFSQAWGEMRTEAQEQRLQQAVDDGRITEEEATQIREWWQARPEALERLGPSECPHMRGAMGQQTYLP